MAERQDFTIYRGNDRTIRVTMRTNGSVAGWTTKFTVRQTVNSDDPPLLNVDGAIEDAGSASMPGVFVFLVTQAQLLTLARRLYVFGVNRINAGAFDTLTKGVMTVRSDVLHAL